MDKQSAKTTLLLYTEWLFPLKQMSLEDVGRVMLAVLQYQIDGTIPELPKAAEVAFKFMLLAIERNNEKYEETKAKRQMAGSLGGKARARNAKIKAKEKMGEGPEANASNAIIMQGKQGVHVPGPDRDSVPDLDPVPAFSPLSPMEGERDREKEFAILANAYPRQEAIAAAREAYESVPVQLDVLLAAIEEQKGSDQWQRDGGRYIPQLNRWLTEERWQDHYQSSSRGYIRHDDPPTPGMIADIKRMLQESDDYDNYTEGDPALS